MEYRNYLFVSPTAILGGAERVMFNLMFSLLEDGHKVIFVCMSRGKQSGWDELLKYENFHPHFKEYPSEKTSIFPFIKFIYKISREQDIHLTFSSHTHVNGLLSFLRKIKILNTKYLISRESTVIFDRFFGIWRYIFLFIYKFLYGKQDLLISQTEYMKSQLIKSLRKAPCKKIEVLDNPVNFNYINLKLNENNILEYNSNKKIIVGCGRFISLKKFDNLILAFSQMEKRENYILVLIGDGPERSNYEKIVNDNHLNESVIFTGKILNPLSLFAISDIGVISSKIEGFPNVLLEMMAAGTKKIMSTPCSPGVMKLPNISLTKSCNVKDILLVLNELAERNESNCLVYKDYIKSHRSSEIFIKKIYQKLGRRM